MLKEIEYPSFANYGGVQRVSWGAIFAGAITSLAVMLALVSLGMGIGFIAAPAVDAAGGAMGLGIGSGIGLLLCGIVAYYVGGWVAGRLTGIARISESVLHGFVSWSTATVMSAFLFASAALGAFGAASNVVGGALGMAREGETGMVRPGVADEIVPEGAGQAASQAAGAAGLFAFLMLACNAGASCLGARHGTRLLKPVPAPETRREREKAGV